MNSHEYTEEEKKDIEERVEKAKTMLAELNLQPSAQVQKVNTGNDIFADKVIPFLQDTKYTPKLSPIQK